MTKIHCTLEKTVKREALQTRGRWLDHHGAEDMPDPVLVFCSLLGTSVPLQMAALLQTSGTARTAPSLLSRDPA